MSRTQVQFSTIPHQGAEGSGYDDVSQPQHGERVLLSRVYGAREQELHGRLDFRGDGHLVEAGRQTANRSSVSIKLFKK